MFTMVYHLLFFLNTLKTSGHRGYVFLEFWCWNCVPFFPDISFQQLKSSWSSDIFFVMPQMFSIGESSGASCINIAHAQNGHRNVLKLFSKHISGFIQK